MNNTANSVANIPLTISSSKSPKKRGLKHISASASSQNYFIHLGWARNPLKRNSNHSPSINILSLSHGRKGFLNSFCLLSLSNSTSPQYSTCSLKMKSFLPPLQVYTLHLLLPFSVFACEAGPALGTLRTVAHQAPWILQSRILEGVATASSRGSSWLGDLTCSFSVFCIGRQKPLAPPGKSLFSL